VRLTEVEARIAELEAQLASREESESESEEASTAEDQQADDELERIPPLPAHLLPAPGISKVVQAKAELDQPAAEEEERKPTQRFFCDACNYTAFDPDVWKKHKRTLLHRQNLVLQAGAAYEPARKRSCYCRPCALTFETPEALFQHRETAEHERKVQKDRKASYCQVCRKQFTSAHQLQEHIKGKVHKDMLSGLKEKWSAG
jgi:hypothetical protein